MSPKAPREVKAGFVPPPYPYDRLAEVAKLAARHRGGMVDCSIGTPCDPPARAVIAALSHSNAERGYPASIGSEAFRVSAAQWVERRFGVTIEPEHVAACVGTKEFVASSAWYLKLSDPSRDTVLYPAVSYPTYAMSAQLAGCRAVAVPELAGGGLDLDSIDPEDAERAVVLWVNSPSNPTGKLSDLKRAAEWGKARDLLVCSDECYAEFTWAAPPATILTDEYEGVLALHSLSKRSNLAGARVGFYAGDPDVVKYFSEVRKHAGLMVPGPVQSAAVVAFDHDAPVVAQRVRYRRRLEWLAKILSRSGLEVPFPDGGFYLWVPVPAWAIEEGKAKGRKGGWELAYALADAAGLLVSPGDLYGEDGENFVRVALTVPDEKIKLVMNRLKVSTHSHLRYHKAQ